MNEEKIEIKWRNVRAIFFASWILGIALCIDGLIPISAGVMGTFAAMGLAFLHNQLEKSQSKD